MAERPAAYIMHEIEGRMRLRAPRLAGRAEPLRQIAMALAAHREIDAASERAATGCIILNHRLPRPALLALLAEHLDMRPPPSKAAPERPTLRAGRLLNDANRALRRASGGQLELEDLGLVLLGLAIAVQLARGRAFAQASSLLATALALAASRQRG